MEKNQAKNLIKKTFNERFNKETFREFIINLLDNIDESKFRSIGNAQVKEAFQKYILSYQRLGQYKDKESNIIDVLVVHLNDTCSLDRNRTMLRNFVADYMKTRQKENTLVAFYNDNKADWRFSFVKLEMSLKQDESGKVKVINEFTSAKRFSFLVGELEPNHTAQSRLVSLLEKDYPTLNEIEEAFNVEKVSKEFFANYKDLFLQLVDDLKEIRANEVSQRINFEFTTKSIKEADFCKKLLGQLVFLYFIQKKGWLGVSVDKKWGEGDKQFLRHTFEKAVNEGKNFFNDYLEPLFYNALANGERDNNYFELLDCKIPFLNGGLFETIGGYSWTETDIILDNTIFSNNEKTKNGDMGTGILDVFDRYNFTVKEDEPLEKEVAVDPEMLGKVFEELLEVEDRKSKGAFYTPREIVHYMCQESLINYLATELNAVEEETSSDGHSELVSESNQLTKQAISDFIHHSDKLSQAEFIATEKENNNSKYQHQIHQSIIENAQKIDDALANIKICDPAIGSGAFPVGMLNEIVRARIALVESGFLRETKKRSIYEYKRQAIQNSIYGVDIEAGAVEIAKLRLWLSLVVDEEDIENIKALPNLDYKIVCGNSLLNVERNLLNDILYRKLEELKPQFFNETRKAEKRRLKKEIDAIIKELTKDGTFDFEIYFSEVFNKGGFDVIIANPPYVGEKGHKELFEPIKKCSLKEFYLGKMDLFYFFFHLALNLLSNGGQCAFITTNYYITALGARLLRKDFKERAVLKELINFNELKIFESALGQHNLITILEKGQREQTKCKLINVNKKGYIDNSFDAIVNGSDTDTLYNSIPQNNLYEGQENYIRLLKEESNSVLSTVLNKILKNNELLGNISDINSGADVTISRITNKHLSQFSGNYSYNDGVFVLSNQEIKSLQLNDREKDIIKDYVKNSNIYKYGTTLNEDKLIYLKWEDNIDIYPHIKSHLSRFKEILQDQVVRYEENYPWWALHRPRVQTIFDSDEKIIVPYRTKNNIFGYCEKPLYSSRDVFFITNIRQDFNIKYVLSLLNSNLYYIWLYNKGKRKGETLELIAKPLSEIPIKKADKDIQNKFISVVDKILAITQTEDYLQNEEKQNAVKEYEKQIDIMVYKLYELTYEEVLTIDKDFTLTQEEYENYVL